MRDGKKICIVSVPFKLSLIVVRFSITTGSLSVLKPDVLFNK